MVLLQLLLVEYHAKLGTLNSLIVTAVLQTIILTKAWKETTVGTQTASHGKLRQYLLCGLISMYILLITHIYSLIISQRLVLHNRFQYTMGLL